MCHDDSSRPPIPADAGKVASSEPDLHLRSADGTLFMAHGAHATTPSGAGVVVLPDVRGLHTFYRDLTDGFASLGVDAVAIDYFGRTAQTTDRSEAFEYGPHVEQTTPETVAADVAAAAQWLRADTKARSIFTVGFCFGGGNSWRSSAHIDGIAGSIGFYGRPSVAADVAEKISAPLLMLPAGADQHIPVADVQALAEAVRSHGTEADVHVYEGKPHSFFDRSFGEHAVACQDAWIRMRTFITDHTD